MEVGRGCGVVRRRGDTRSLTQLYREAIDEAVAAEVDGYDFITAHERHGEQDPWNHSPLQVLTAIAARTTTVRLGTAILVGSFYHPLRLAEDVATLDVISGGRLSLLAIGSGSGEQGFAAYDVGSRDRYERTFEVLAILRRAFSQETFEHSGTFFHFPKAGFMMKPARSPFPLWLAAFGPKMLHRAGREGYHTMNTLETSWHFEAYEKGLREGGHRVEEVNVAVSASEPVLAPTKRQVEELRERVRRSTLQNLVGHFRRRDFGQEYQAVWQGWSEQHDLTRFRQGLIGTPDQVLADLEPVLKDSMVTHLKVDAPRIGGPTSERLWLEEVVPVIRTWGRQPVDRQIPAPPPGPMSERSAVPD